MVANDNWLWRGFQSAVFYYVSCGPCFTRHALRKRRREGKAALRERAAAIEDQELDMHLQPAPFQVNPHWNEEILLGPGPPSRRKNRTGTAASRGLTTAGTVTTAGSTAGSSLSDLGPVQSMSSVHLASPSWNTKRYQRADEEFAYFPPLEEETRPHGHRTISSQGSSVGVGGWNTEEAKKPAGAFYIPARAPPVNDLHPPIVSTVPAKKNERAWMMEPPPSASFMNGKKGVTTRSRSGSGNSGTSSMKNTDPSLGRMVGYRMVEEKVRRGVTSVSQAESSTANCKSTSITATGRSSSMNGRGSSSLDVDGPDRTPSKRRKRPPPVKIPQYDSSSDGDDSSSSCAEVLRPTNKGNRPKSTGVPLKPQPSTAERPGLRTKSESSGNSKVKPSKDHSLISIPPSTLPPPESCTVSTTLNPHLSSQRSSPDVRVGGGEIVDEYDDSPRKVRQRIYTKTDDEEDSSNDSAMDDEALREREEQHRNELLVKDSSLRTLQDQVEIRGLKGNRFIQSPVIEARVPLPATSDELIKGEMKRWSFDL